MLVVFMTLYLLIGLFYIVISLLTFYPFNSINPCIIAVCNQNAYLRRGKKLVIGCLLGVSHANTKTSFLRADESTWLLIFRELACMTERKCWKNIATMLGGLTFYLVI